MCQTDSRSTYCRSFTPTAPVDPSRIRSCVSDRIASQQHRYASTTAGTQRAKQYLSIPLAAAACDAARRDGQLPRGAGGAVRVSPRPSSGAAPSDGHIGDAWTPLGAHGPDMQLARPRSASAVRTQVRHLYTYAAYSRQRKRQTITRSPYLTLHDRCCAQRGIDTRNRTLTQRLPLQGARGNHRPGRRPESASHAVANGAATTLPVHAACSSRRSIGRRRGCATCHWPRRLGAAHRRRGCGLLRWPLVRRCVCDACGTERGCAATTSGFGRAEPAWKRAAIAHATGEPRVRRRLGLNCGGGSV